MTGWIQLHRDLRKWEWYTDINTCHLFIYCLLRANYEDTKWRGISIKRGSFITSLDTLSKETGLTVRQVRTCLDKLKVTGELTSKPTNKNRVITVTNYDTYQDNDKQSVRQVTSQRQTNDKQVTTDNNINNNNNIKKESRRVERRADIAQQMVSVWNEKVQTILTGGKVMLTDARKKKLPLRLADFCNNNIEEWKACCEQITNTPFLMGKNNKQWKVSIDWILKPENITKLIEGNYNGQSNNNGEQHDKDNRARAAIIEGLFESAQG